jgi:hypothetical protein
LAFIGAPLLRVVSVVTLYRRLFRSGEVHRANCNCCVERLLTVPARYLVGTTSE